MSCVLHLQSLVNWDPENEQCLVNLLNELLQQYRLHHRELVARNERLSFELNTLLESSEYPKVDVYCSPAQDSVGSNLLTLEIITKRPPHHAA